MDTAAPVRLTREERRAQTRERLLDAAADVFNRLGYHGASLEAVADAAGYTKGAVYSNFASKGELFFALCERKSAAGDLAATRQAFDRMPIGDFVASTGGLISSQASRDETWDILTIEVWLAAMRDPALRSVVARSYREMRAEFGPAIERKLAGEGISVPFTGAELGTLVSAIGTGLILQYYLESEEVDPELLPRALRRILGLPEDGPPAATDG